MVVSLSTCEVEDEVVVASEGVRDVLRGVFLAGADSGDCESWRGRLLLGCEEREAIVVVVVYVIALLVGGIKLLTREEFWWLKTKSWRLKMEG